MSIFRQERLQKLTVAEAALASLQSSIVTLRARHAELTYELGVRQDELDEVAAQLVVLEPALAKIADPFDIELTVKELTYEER